MLNQYLVLAKTGLLLHGCEIHVEGTHNTNYL